MRLPWTVPLACDPPNDAPGSPAGAVVPDTPPLAVGLADVPGEPTLPEPQAASTSAVAAMSPIHDLLRIAHPFLTRPTIIGHASEARRSRGRSDGSARERDPNTVGSKGRTGDPDLATPSA